MSAGPEGLAERVSEPLEALRQALEASRLVRFVPPRALRFLEGHARRLARTVQIAGNGTLGRAAYALADAVPALDEIDFALRRSRRRLAVVDPLADARACLAAALAETPGVAVLPRLDPPPRDRESLEAAVSAFGLTPAAALAIERVPAPARADALVSVERRGLVEGKTLVSPARVQVSSGAPLGARGELLEAALVALEAAWLEAPGAGPSAREDVARLARDLDRSERDEPAANGEAALRFAVGALERASAVPAARAATVAYLRGRGIEPIRLEAGVRFDPERHPPSGFERCLARGGPASPGTVLATDRTGFRDARGVVLDRARVLVAE